MENDHNKVILVVEDEPAYHQVLTDKLGREGFTVRGATNGEDGLAQALALHPNLILLDLHMPKMDGLAMAKQLRADEWGKTAKIIILTNLSDTERVAEAIETDVFEYLVKADTSLENLVERVRATVEAV